MQVDLKLSNPIFAHEALQISFPSFCWPALQSLIELYYSFNPL
jgi:hypothetical protein